MTDTLSEQLISWRRELHQHPELSNHEFATTERITAWLKQADIRVLPFALKTGVVVEIGQGEPLIALRADIDALPIEEATAQPFASKNPGVMHACGHDVHTSVMLGVAYQLKALEKNLKGRVRILFQPAEETFNGAQQLIDAGALEGVQAIFGMHNAPDLPLGTLKTRGGAFYANVDRFEINIQGKGAHAARPHEGIDSVVIGSQIVTTLQTLASRIYSSQESVVVSVTRFTAGNTWNVLPQSVELEGTVRTHNEAIRREIPERIRTLINGIAGGFGATATLNWQPGPPALVNTPQWADFALSVARETGYQTEVATPQMGGEDFAFYLHHVPGAFVSIGSASSFGLHHPSFDPNEAIIDPAVAYFTELAQRALDQVKQQNNKSSL
ncbi:amidohydrolase [Rouxiella badensis]|uniref:Hydrolase n=1 Tax=Rouxiella badensis TaxID=1646377 RepID=A0A1X0WB95_9GAMM|nr:amidohydrolase [Rouxiella badensis]MCC3721016.1 amidohydrolase [Rouxiella badensis]MCC3729535.1 amidohydrolase [Rouxiella badensis]MCC3735438.1 amidohydrolase [Rouxiella badensis]MCC3741203.1 amidohydrolase [Rouxiella badensis]MCC3746278.1 amidohydrolase [Rouxiella badensis]